MTGGEVDRVKDARGGGVGTIGAARVGRDGEPGDGSEFDSEGADGGEDAVVGGVLEDEDALPGVDLEELRRRRVANGVAIGGPGDAGVLPRVPIRGRIGE